MSAVLFDIGVMFTICRLDNYVVFCWPVGGGTNEIAHPKGLLRRLGFRVGESADMQGCQCNTPLNFC
jgi:hypothetical protein